MRRKKVIIIFASFLTVIAIFILGFYSGWNLAFWQKNRYSEALTEYYIQGRKTKLAMARRSIVRAEEQKCQEVIEQNAFFLRGGFLALVDLHKSGQYDEYEPSIRSSLKAAAEFINERKQLFSRSLDSFKHTDHERKKLKNKLESSLEYVRDLPEPNKK